MVLLRSLTPQHRMCDTIFILNFQSVLTYISNLMVSSELIYLFGHLLICARLRVPDHLSGIGSCGSVYLFSLVLILVIRLEIF